MKILVLGCRGMLGSDVVSILSEEHNVIGATKNEIDITNFDLVREKIMEYRPETIINCAAYTDVDGCEVNQDLAFAVNGYGVKNLAIICEEMDITLIHISTDYVFDGTLEAPYREEDRPRPLNVYGKSKLMGENFIRENCDKFFIVRTQWLFGENGNNFVKTMLKLSEEKDCLKVVNDQFGCPTYTRDVAQIIECMLHKDSYGIYHVTNDGIVTWYEFACEIFKLYGINVEVMPCSSEEFPRPAPRPKFSVLENHMLTLYDFPKRRSYKKALREYMSRTTDQGGTQ